MSLLIQCANCNRRYNLDEKMAGKKVKCKECGTVFVAQTAAPAASAPPATRASAAPAAGPAVRPAAGPAIRPAARSAAAAPPRQVPPPPPPRMEEDDDPFAAMSLLEAGTPMPPESNGPMYSGASASMSMRAPSAPAQAYTFAAPPRPRRATSSKSLGVDSLTPILLLILVVGMIVVGFVGVYKANGVNESLPPERQLHPLSIKYAKTMIWTMVTTLTVGHFAIVSPLVLLAVFIASKIMRFELPGAAYLRSAGVAALPLVVLAGIDLLAPNNLVIRAALVVSILPLGFYVLKNIFELLLTETLVAYVFVCVFFVIGIVISFMTTGVVVAAGIVQSEADVDKAIRADNEKKRDEYFANRRSSGTPGYTPGYTPSSSGGNVDRPPPVTVDPMETRAQSLQRRLEAFDARNVDQLSRESVERDFASLRAEVDSATSPLRARPEWANIQQLQKTILAKISAMPTEQPDPAIFTPMPATTAFAPPANGVAALEQEVSFGRFNFRPPEGAKLDLRESSATRHRMWIGNSSSEPFTIEIIPRASARQQRPWLLTRPFHKSAAQQQQLYFIEGNEGAQVNYGTLGGLPAAKVEGEAAGGQRFFQYVVLDGSNWIVMRSQSRSDTAAMDAFELAARTLRPRPAGEPVIDPFAPDRIADRLGEDPEGVSNILRKNAAAAEPIAIRLLSSPDLRTRRAAADLLPFVLSEKSLSQIEPLATHTDDHVAAVVRGLLKKMKPQAFDEVAVILLDLKTDDTFKRRAALEKLVKMPPDEKRRNEVAALLEGFVTQERAFGVDAEAAANALAAWPGDKTAARIAPLLNDANLWGPRRDVLLTAISGTREKLAVNVVMKWMPKAPEKVTPILIKMGPIAEDEAIRVLNIYFANNTADGPKVRAGCVSVLAEVGTAKSMEVLGRASRDKRDLVTQESAKQAMETIKARTAKPPAAPATKAA